MLSHYQYSLSMQMNVNKLSSLFTCVHWISISGYSNEPIESRWNRIRSKGLVPMNSGFSTFAQT